MFFLSHNQRLRGLTRTSIGIVGISSWMKFLTSLVALMRNLPETHGLISSLVSTSPVPDTQYDLLTIDDDEQLKTIAENKHSDEVWDEFKELAYTLLSPRWDSYVGRKSYENLIDGGGSKLTVFSLLRPDIVYGFRSVTLAGACFKDSLLYRYWSKRGIGFTQTTKLNLRYNQHENGDKLTILWAVEQDWSKWLSKQKDGQVLKMIAEAVRNEFCGSNFLFAQNKGDDLFRGIKNAILLPNAPHGLNNFSHIGNVVFLPARNLKPSHCKFLEHMIDFTADEIRTAIHRQVAYQTVMRGSLRDPENHEPKRIFVPDLGTAEWLKSHFPGATLRKLETDFHKLGLPVTRGRKRIYSSDAERKKASRQRLKENKIKEFNELLNHEAPNDNQLLNINFHNIGHDMSISTNSNFVTEFRGSLFENIYSKRGVIYSTKTIGDFEKELENAFLNEIYDKKEDNILICASAFDPDKVVKTDRGLDNVVFASGIWLDFDGGDLSPDKLSRLFPSIRMTIYSSFSSSKSSLRFRVYISTDTTMNAKQYRAVVDAILSVIRTGGFKDKKLTRKSKIHGLDMGKRNASSLFYLPCKPKDPSGAYFKIFKRKPRKPLVVQEWIKKYIAKEEEGTFIETPLQETDIGSLETHTFMPQEASGFVDQEAVERACAEWKVCPPGKGNDRFFKLGLKLASAGCDRSEISRF